MKTTLYLNNLTVFGLDQFDSNIVGNTMINTEEVEFLMYAFSLT